MASDNIIVLNRHLNLTKYLTALSGFDTL